MTVCLPGFSKDSTCTLSIKQFVTFQEQLSFVSVLFGGCYCLEAFIAFMETCKTNPTPPLSCFVP